jgi:hypothetical protein
LIIKIIPSFNLEKRISIFLITYKNEKKYKIKIIKYWIRYIDTVYMTRHCIERHCIHKIHYIKYVLLDFIYKLILKIQLTNKYINSRNESLFGETSGKICMHIVSP